MIVEPDIVGIKLCIYGSTSGFDIHKRARKRADAVFQHMNTLMPRSVLQFETLTSLNVDQKKLALKSIQGHIKIMPYKVLTPVAAYSLSIPATMLFESHPQTILLWCVSLGIHWGCLINTLDACIHVLLRFPL